MRNRDNQGKLIKSEWTENAKAIADLSKVIVSGIKIQADIIKTIANCENPELTNKILASSEILKLENNNK